MPFFLKPCTQQQIVITNKDLENLEGIDLDFGSASAETETSSQEVAQPCTSTPNPQTPAQTKGIDRNLINVFSINKTPVNLAAANTLQPVNIVPVNILEDPQDSEMLPLD
uniref:Uncharacterized protein n=1 Tax=Magallana gigas TaxID=29159 RepID=A0A8W8P1W5_MAGGI